MINIMIKNLIFSIPFFLLSFHNLAEEYSLKILGDNSIRELIVDKEKLLKQVWNYSSDVTTHTLETHIYRLRQKLEIDSSIPRLIISKGGGFTIRAV